MFSSIGDVLQPVLQLLVREDWKTLRSTVLADPTLFRKIASAISACSEFNGMTLLHATVRYNPPSDIIAQMIHLCPHMTAATDCLDRTPLHVAAGSGSSPEVIAMIAHANPPACDIRDRDGKTPLHFACDGSCSLFDDDDDLNSSKQALNHELVHALLSYSVRAAFLQDDRDMLPLQYALLSHASSKTVILIGDAMMEFFSSQQSFKDRPCKRARKMSVV